MFIMIQLHHASLCISLASQQDMLEVPQFPLTLPVFLTYIGSQMPSKWRMFGILLDIPWSELDTYPAHSCVDCFARVFDTWEKKGHPEFSWETVVSVLKNPLLEEMQLALKVRQKMSEDAPKQPMNPMPVSNGTRSDAANGKLSLQRSRLLPGHLPLSPPKIPAKQKNLALEQPKHLVPVVNGNQHVQRSGSTSSHSSHASHLSFDSHVSHASDGSIITQTLC